MKELTEKLLQELSEEELYASEQFDNNEQRAFAIGLRRGAEITLSHSVWSDCKEQLPDVDVPVLAILKWMSGKTVPAVLKRVKEDDCNWRTVDDNSEISYSLDVTHWMPIAATPKPISD